MAHIYHLSCFNSRWRRLVRLFRRARGVPRFIYKKSEFDDHAHTQTLVCDGCGTRLHVDTNWDDKYGGFIGSAVS